MGLMFSAIFGVEYIGYAAVAGVAIGAILSALLELGGGDE